MLFILPSKKICNDIKKRTFGRSLSAIGGEGNLIWTVVGRAVGVGSKNQPYFADVING